MPDPKEEPARAIATTSPSAFEAIVAKIRARRLPATNEPDIHAALCGLLAEAGFIFDHEVRLDRKSRIDFTVTAADGTLVGIEIKFRTASDNAMMRQAIRYALTGKLGGLILITGRAIAYRLNHLEGPGGVKIPARIISPVL